MRNPAFDAMLYARHAHRNQMRRYTGEPYITHLAEVVGIVSSVGMSPDGKAVAWLHDVREDQGVSHVELLTQFGGYVADGVAYLSDLETGNRAARKAAARARLAEAPDWVQTIKVADLISNTDSIVRHDPAFARVYLQEKAALLDVLKHADPQLMTLAQQILIKAMADLGMHTHPTEPSAT